MVAPHADVELDSMNDDAAAEPLIPSSRARDLPPSDGRNRYSSDDAHATQRGDDEADETALLSPGVFIWILTMCAGVSGLLFGYE